MTSSITREMSFPALGLSRSLCFLRMPWITHKQLHSCALGCYLCCLIRGILVPSWFLETYSLCWSQGSKCVPTLPAVLVGLHSALQPAISKVNHLFFAVFSLFLLLLNKAVPDSLCYFCKLWRWWFDFKYSHRLCLLSQSFSFKSCYISSLVLLKKKLTEFLYP